VSLFYGNTADHEIVVARKKRLGQVITGIQTNEIADFAVVEISCEIRRQQSGWCLPDKPEFWRRQLIGHDLKDRKHFHAPPIPLRRHSGGNVHGIFATVVSSPNSIGKADLFQIIDATNSAI
jgi:hypothetical protein